MSKILKRPMFRKGGEVMEGIMTGVKPRKNYANGTDEQIQEIFEASGLSPSGRSYAETAMKLANIGRPSSNDLIARALISGGLKGFSTTGKGSTLANLASAFEKPVTSSVDAYIKGKGMGTAGALKGLELGIKKDIADKTIQSKLQQKQFESGTLAAITKEVQKALGEGTVGQEAAEIAVNISPKVAKARTTKGILYQGIMKLGKDGKPDLNPGSSNVLGQPEGAVFLHPRLNLFYVISDGKLKRADQNTLRAPEEE